MRYLHMLVRHLDRRLNGETFRSVRRDRGPARWWWLARLNHWLTRRSRRRAVGLWRMEREHWDVADAEGEARG